MPPPPRLCSRSKLTPDQPVLGVVKAGGRREGRKAFLSFSLLASTVTAWPRLEAAAAVALVAAANMVATATMVVSVVEEPSEAGVAAAAPASKPNGRASRTTQWLIVSKNRQKIKACFLTLKN